MKNSLRVAVLVSALFVTVAAHAADVVFPSGARVGIVPLDGLKASKEFVGFENDDKTLKVGVAEIPPAAFTAVETAFKEGKPVADGNKVEPFKTAITSSGLI